jgi:hypothetical protein
VGDYSITVTADNYYGTSYVYELNSDGTAESNNTASITVTSTLAPYPDLIVTDLSVDPPNPQSSQQVTIHWKDANTGDSAAVGSWGDRIQVVNTTTGQPLPDMYLYNYTNNIAAGAYADRSYSFNLPNGSAGVGDYSITVTADNYYGTSYVYELNAIGDAESNNTATVSFSSTLAAFQFQAMDAKVTTSSNVDAPRGKVQPDRTAGAQLKPDSISFKNLSHGHSFSGLRQWSLRANSANLSRLRDVALISHFDDCYLSDEQDVLDFNCELVHDDGDKLKDSSDHRCLDEAFSELLLGVII